MDSFKMWFIFLLFTFSFTTSYTNEEISSITKKPLSKDALISRAQKNNNRFHPFYLREGSLHRFALYPSEASPKKKLLKTLMLLCNEPQKVTMADYLAFQNALTSKKVVDSSSLDPDVMVYYDIKPNGYKKASLAYFISTSHQLDEDTKVDFLQRLGGLENLKKVKYRQEIYNRRGFLVVEKSVSIEMLT